MSEPTDAPARPTNRPADITSRTPPPARRIPVGIALAVTALGVVLVGIIAVAFRGSWTAHRDAALAAHFDPTGAALYPFAPDGLIVIALIASIVLRNDRKARLYALTVVGVFTITSFVVNHLHGLGQFTLSQASGLRPDLPWPVVALIAGQVIGAIFFGSHLIVSALRYLFPSTSPDQAVQPSEGQPETVQADTASTPPAGAAEPVEPVIVHAEADPHDIAALVYGAALDLDLKVGRDRLAKVCGISARQAGRIRSDVEADREEAAARAAEEEAERVAREAAGADPAAELTVELVAEPSGAATLNGSSATGTAVAP